MALTARIRASNLLNHLLSDCWKNNISEIHGNITNAQEENFVQHKHINKYLIGNARVRITNEVKDAIINKKPIVALESTIITHGMPFPQNMTTALEVENEARKLGVVPATIAIMRGKLHIGLTHEEIKELAEKGHNITKCSRRDIAILLAQGNSNEKGENGNFKGYGATTVAATMFAANLVGIPIFVTGGIGGVHRGVEESMDISADLTELGRTPTTVVCAGIKSILDIGRTLEYLETQGVSVCSYQSKQFPAFFTPNSGFQSPYMVSSPNEVAKIIDANRSLDISSGIVIAVPIPDEHSAMSDATEKATSTALQEAKSKNISGRDVTPFLLSRVNELTGGESLRANIELIKNNCRIGSLIAIEYANLISKNKSDHSYTSNRSSAALTNANTSGKSHPSPIVIGGTNQDILGRPQPGSKFLLHTSNPGTLVRHWGGVGRNIAECMGRCGAKPILISAVGDDEAGRSLKDHCIHVGIRPEGLITSEGHNTGTYLGILDESGDLFTTIADMRVCDTLTPNKLDSSLLNDAPLVLMDGNIPQNTIEFVAKHCANNGIPVFFDPTSIEKCIRAANAIRNGHINFISPSPHELLALAESLGYNVVIGKGKAAYADNKLDEAAMNAQMSFILDIATKNKDKFPFLRYFHILSKRGSKGVVLSSAIYDRHASTYIRTQHILSSRKVEDIVNTSGCGDSLAGAFCWYITHQLHNNYTNKMKKAGDNMQDVLIGVQLGMRAAELGLQSQTSISPHVTSDTLLATLNDGK